METQKNILGGWSDKPFGDHLKKVLFNATTEKGENVAIELMRERADEPPKFKVFFGQVKYRVKAIELQAREIVKQIRYDFRKLVSVDWKPDADLFLRGLHISFSEEKEAITRNLERHLEKMMENGEVFISDRQNVFWLKPDGFFLDPIKYLCNTREKPAEREFFQKFIKEQAQDQTGVLMIKVTFDFWVE